MPIFGLVHLLMLKFSLVLAQSQGSLEKPHAPALQFIPLLIVLFLGVGLFVYIAAVKFKTPVRRPPEKKADDTEKEL